MELPELTASKELKITHAPTSSPKDFDFLEGKWKVHNRKLKTRLNSCTEWTQFGSELHMRKTLMGNIENYYVEFDGNAFEGMAVRLFDPQTKLWTIHWIDSNHPWVDEHPVTSSYKNGIGN